VTPEKSRLRATPEVMASWDTYARKTGCCQPWRLSDHELQASRLSVLARHAAGEDLWIYAYGSLMWDPGIHFAEVRRASLDGFQRRFAHKTCIGRGTLQNPALSLSIMQHAGSCQGLAFRIPGDLVEAESAILWRREMLLGGYSAQILRMTTPQGEIMALALTSDSSHHSYVGNLPLNEAATLIAKASGILGSNREYLEQLAHQLGVLEIEDTYVERLLQKVCSH